MQEIQKRRDRDGKEIARERKSRFVSSTFSDQLLVSVA